MFLFHLYIHVQQNSSTFEHMGGVKCLGNFDKLWYAFEEIWEGLNVLDNLNQLGYPFYEICVLKLFLSSSLSGQKYCNKQG